MSSTEYLDFIHSRPLSWWRGYMQHAYGVYAQLLKRPLTKEDKRKLWTRLKYNHAYIGGIGSSGVLAMMQSAFDDSLNRNSKSEKDVYNPVIPT